MPSCKEHLARFKTHCEILVHTYVAVRTIQITAACVDLELVKATLVVS